MIRDFVPPLLIPLLRGLRDRMRKTRRRMKRLAKAARVSLFEAEAFVSRRWASAAHRRLRHAQWFIPPCPEFFDHHIDLFHWWLHSRNSLWLERGVFGSLALRGGDVLELACGDGFNARNFYSLRSKKVIACDFDPTAIATARRKNAAPNVEFLLADIRTHMPNGVFQNIVWDAAIEHFTPLEIQQIMVDIKKRLAPGGILSGYTIVERPDAVKSLDHHEHEFRDMADLYSFLAPHFDHVKIFETIYPERHNLYFWAADGVVPFDPQWASMYRRSEP
jgi:SAM-dependent methyltransferase